MWPYRINYFGLNMGIYFLINNDLIFRKTHVTNKLVKPYNKKTLCFLIFNKDAN